MSKRPHGRHAGDGLPASEDDRLKGFITMKCTIFGKTKKAGKTEWIEYSTRLTRKDDGTEEYFRVKFNPKEIAPKLKDCPINIEFTPGIDANKGKPEEFEKNDELIRIPVIWINRYDVGDPWVDHSLDDYE